MKKIILFCLFLIIEVYPQSGYTVELKKIYCYWQSQENWATKVETIIRHNGSQIPPDSNYYYEYHLNTGGSTEVRPGYGKNTDESDATKNWVQSWYVVVTDESNHHYFSNLVSDTVYFQMETDYFRAEKVYLKQLKSDGSSLSGANFMHWMYPVEQWQDINGTTYTFLTRYQDEVLKSSPDFLSSNNNKFYYWDYDNSKILNYNHFYYTDSLSTDTAKANYKVSNGNVTIQNDIDGTSGDSVEFNDPWLVDYDESPYGMRNQGMSAPFKKVPSPFNPDFNSDYKGVFLSQLVSSNIYYSIRAPLNPTVNGSPAIFLGWDYNSNYADIQQIGSNPSGYDQKAVVFKQSGATITANYTFNTISRNVTLGAGTYNIAGTLTVNSGITLTINSGTTLNFPSGGGLVVNGTLTANGGTFTSNSSSWIGITLNDAEGSTIHNLTISKALAPIKINNTSNVTISGCTINNSSFYDGNYNSAIQVSNSTPTISLTTITGQGDSQNGITFYNGSGDYFFDFSC